jgi:hypothetical protein
MSVVIPSLRGAIAVPSWAKNELWRKAAAVPSLDLRFADSKSLVDATTGSSLVTFTRASSGTYTDSDGVLQTAVTNLLLRSEEFETTWTTTRASVSSDLIASPSGTTTADKLVEDTTATSTHFVQQSVSVTTGTAYAFSLFAKAGERNFVQLVLNGQFAAVISAIFDLSTGAVGITTGTPVTSAVLLSDGWWRLSITATANATGSTLAQVRVSNFSTTATYTGDGTSGIYLWGAQLEQSATANEYIPTTSTINSAPRFDHNPTTGESLGLLVEGQRTNSIRNNTMVGAVAGTPGTVPVNWTAGGNAALSREIVGTGIENGISYIDIRFFGTVASVAVPEMSIIFDSNQTAVAAVSQAWTASSYLKVVGGSLSNVTTGEIFVLGFNSSFALTEASSTVFNYSTLTGALQTGRVSHTRTLLTGTTVSVNSRVDINFPGGGGVDVDITLRIGLPQLEQGAFATSPIPTTTAAVTRSADVASITGSAFTSFYNQTEGSFFCSTFAPKGSVVFGTGDTFDNTQYISAALSFNVTIRSGGAGSATLTAPVSKATVTNIAHGYAANNFAAVSNGGTIATDTSGAVPLAQVRLKLGSSAWDTGGSNNINGHIRRLAYWGQRLPNNVLQQITQ